jgi:DNA invertase Pin-like site-specific DNA recombinase
VVAACRRRGWRLLEDAPAPARDGKRSRVEGRRVRAAATGETLVAAKQLPSAQALPALTSLIAAVHKQGWALVALDWTLEPPSPAGEALANVVAAFAQCERPLLSKRIREGLAHARAQGVRLGRPPTISHYALERIKRERAAGKSLAAIANGLNADRVPTAQGGQRWYPATVRYTLARAE